MEVRECTVLQWLAGLSQQATSHTSPGVCGKSCHLRAKLTPQELSDSNLWGPFQCLCELWSSCKSMSVVRVKGKQRVWEVTAVTPCNLLHSSDVWTAQIWFVNQDFLISSGDESVSSLTRVISDDLCVEIYFRSMTCLLTNYSICHDHVDAVEWAGQEYRSLQRRGQLKDRHHVLHQRCAQRWSRGGQHEHPMPYRAQPIR